MKVLGAPSKFTVAVFQKYWELADLNPVQLHVLLSCTFSFMLSSYGKHGLPDFISLETLGMVCPSRTYLITAVTV